MQTPYFQVMTPIYGVHPLVPEEQADVMALLELAKSRQQSQWSTQIVLLAALLLGAAFVALTGFRWRDRVKSVRRAWFKEPPAKEPKFALDQRYRQPKQRRGKSSIATAGSTTESCEARMASTAPGVAHGISTSRKAS